MNVTSTRLAAHSQTINDVRFFNNGQRLLSADLHGSAKIWDVRKPTFWNRKPLVISHHVDVTYRGLTIARGGQHVVFYGSEWTRIWDVDNKRWSIELEDETFRLLTRDSKLLITEGPWNSGLRLRNMKDGDVLATIDLDAGKIRPSHHPAMDDMTEEEIDAHTPNALIAHVAEVDDGLVVVSYENHKTFVINLATHEVDGPMPYIVKTVHPNGHTALARESSSDLIAFDLLDDTIEPVRLSDAIETYGIGEVTFLANGDVVTTNDNALRVWQNETWTCRRTIAAANEKEPGTNPRDSRITTIAVLNDGTRIATASGSDRPRIWNVDTGEGMGVEGSDDEVVDARKLRVHSDGLIGNPANSLVLWDTQSGEAKWKVADAGAAFDIAPNGTIIAASGAELVIVN